MGPGDCAGMRHGGRRRSRRSAGLYRDHRFGARCGARGRHELGWIGDAFDIKKDRAGMRIGREQIDQVAEIDIAHVADRNDARKAHLAIRRPIEHRGDDRPALRDQRRATRRGRKPAERRVDASMRQQHAEPVGANNAQAVWLRRIEHCLAKRRIFMDAGADDHRHAGTAFPKLGDRLRHAGGRYRHHRQIGDLRQRGDRGAPNDTTARPLAGIDRLDQPGKAAFDQIVENDRTERACAIRSTNHRDAAGMQQGVKIAHGHRASRVERCVASMGKVGCRTRAAPADECGNLACWLRRSRYCLRSG